jgi:hypothetical protein
MKPQDKKQLSSKQLLERIGCNALPDESLGLLDDDEGLDGDLPALLRGHYHLLKVVKHSFHPGMLVMWKSGLKNRRWPSYGKPLIVVSLLDTPVFDTDESGSTYFREPLDMVIGLFLDSGEDRGRFLTFHACSERYQPWPGEEV